MGKKPVLGIVSALCVGLALTGCRNCSTCQTDGAKVAKNNPPPFQTHPTFQTNTATAAPATTQGWNNSGAVPAKASSPYSPALSTSVGMDQPGMKPADPVVAATSKPTTASVQPAGFAPPTGPTTPLPPDATAPVDANTSHFPPTSTGRILPSPPALAPGSTLPPLEDQRPFQPKLEESTAAPPPPPPPSISHSPSNDAAPLPPGTLPPPPPPPGPNG